MTTVTKTPLPEDVSHKMKLWRQGFGNFPQGYIAFHEALALDALAALESAGVRADISSVNMVSDGWGDPMLVMQVVATTPSGEQVDLRWHDGNQEFFRRLDGGGGVPFRVEVGQHSD